MAKQVNLEVFRNTDTFVVVTAYNAAETEVIDMSTWTLSFMVKVQPQDADASALVTKTSSSGITVTGTYNPTPASNSQSATVTIEDSDTSSLAPGLYFWEFKRTDAGNETVLAYGQFDLRASVHGN